jgi:hypothetical protein
MAEHEGLRTLDGASSAPTDIMTVMFPGRASAEAAIQELRGLGLTDQQFGVAVPDPVTHELADEHDIVGQDELEGTARGFLLGAPIGALAGIALSFMAIGGLGTLGLGGILSVAGAGAVWGMVLGAEAGLIARVRHDEEEDRWSGIQLRPGEIPVVLKAGERAPEAFDIVSRHGGHCVRASNRGKPDLAALTPTNANS